MNAVSKDKKPTAVVSDVITTGPFISSIVARIASRFGPPLAISSLYRFSTWIASAIPIASSKIGAMNDIVVIGKPRRTIAPMATITDSSTTAIGSRIPRIVKKLANNRATMTKIASGKRSAVSASISSDMIASKYASP